MNDTVHYWMQKSRRYNYKTPSVPRVMVRGRYVTRQHCDTCGSDQFFRPLNNLFGYFAKGVKTFECTGCRKEVLMVFATKAGV